MQWPRHWLLWPRSSETSGSLISQSESGIARVLLDRGTDHADITCCSTVTGSVKENIDPWPTCDSTQILPPCSSIIRLDIASPSPVPPFLRVIELSAC